MLGISSLTDRLGSEHGFSLVEMLVAMSIGVVLTTATFALLQLATEQTQRATDYVSASQLGRTAMNHIVDELESACLNENATPVQSESNAEQLLFVTAFSRRAEIQPSEVKEHDIYFKPAAAGSERGALYEEAAAATEKTESGGWKFPAKLPEPGVQIDAHVVLPPKNTKTGAHEIFKYYKYGEKTVESSESGPTPFEWVELASGSKLGENAAHVAAVTVSFRSLPADNSEKKGRDVDLSSQVAFAFSAGFTEPKITSSGACQNS